MVHSTGLRDRIVLLQDPGAPAHGGPNSLSGEDDAAARMLADLATAVVLSAPRAVADRPRVVVMSSARRSATRWCWLLRSSSDDRFNESSEPSGVTPTPTAPRCTTRTSPSEHSSWVSAGEPTPAQDPVARGDWTAASGYATTAEFLRQGAASAVYSANDQMAFGLLRGVQERGLVAPGDLSTIGFDNIPEAPFFGPALTTVRPDFGEGGRRCVANGSRFHRARPERADRPAEQRAASAVDASCLHGFTAGRCCVLNRFMRHSDSANKNGNETARRVSSSLWHEPTWVRRADC